MFTESFYRFEIKICVISGKMDNFHCDPTLFPVKVSQIRSFPSCDALTICLWKRQNKHNKVCNIKEKNVFCAQDVRKEMKWES